MAYILTEPGLILESGINVSAERQQKILTSVEVQLKEEVWGIKVASLMAAMRKVNGYQSQGVILTETKDELALRPSLYSLGGVADRLAVVDIELPWVVTGTTNVRMLNACCSHLVADLGLKKLWANLRGDNKGNLRAFVEIEPVEMALERRKGLDILGPSVKPIRKPRLVLIRGGLEAK